MARIEAVTVPKWGMTMTEGTVVAWLAAEGDTVARGQDLLEMETTKVTNVVEATASGILRHILLPAGATAPVGALAGVIAEAGAAQEEIDAFVARYADRAAAAEGGETTAAARIVTVEGRPLNLLEAGPADGESVVFLHGFGGDLTTWLFNQPVLAETARTVAIDLPGHGGSAPVEGGDPVAAIVSAIAAALETVVPGRRHLVAHSFGGIVAARLAARDPSAAASLTLIAPAGLTRAMDRSFLTDFVAAERRRPLQGVLERLVADPSRITGEMVESTLRFKRLEGVGQALSAIADAIAGDEGQRLSIAADLAALACPVTLVWGAGDTILPVPNTADLPANVQLRVLPDAGHMPQMEAAGAVNAAIAENIRKIQGVCS